MKKARALLLSLLLLSLSLLLTLGRHTGASSYTTRLVCATPHLTTTYVLLQNSDHFELQLVQHNGVRFMPIHNGMVTSYDLDHLKELSQLFKKIGERLSIRFGHDQCGRFFALTIIPAKVAPHPRINTVRYRVGTDGTVESRSRIFTE